MSVISALDFSILGKSIPSPGFKPLWRACLVASEKLSALFAPFVAPTTANSKAETNACI